MEFSDLVTDTQRVVLSFVDVPTLLSFGWTSRAGFALARPFFKDAVARFRRTVEHRNYPAAYMAAFMLKRDDVVDTLLRHAWAIGDEKLLDLTVLYGSKAFRERTGLLTPRATRGELLFVRPYAPPPPPDPMRVPFSEGFINGYCRLLARAEEPLDIFHTLGWSSREYGQTTFCPLLIEEDNADAFFSLAEPNRYDRRIDPGHRPFTILQYVLMHRATRIFKRLRAMGAYDGMSPMELFEGLVVQTKNGLVISDTPTRRANEIIDACGGAEFVGHCAPLLVQKFFLVLQLSLNRTGLRADFFHIIADYVPELICDTYLALLPHLWWDDFRTSPRIGDVHVIAPEDFWSVLVGIVWRAADPAHRAHHLGVLFSHLNGSPFTHKYRLYKRLSKKQRALLPIVALVSNDEEIRPVCIAAIEADGIDCSAVIERIAPQLLDPRHHDTVNHTHPVNNDILLRALASRNVFAVDTDTRAYLFVVAAHASTMPWAKLIPYFRAQIGPAVLKLLGFNVSPSSSSSSQSPRIRLCKGALDRFLTMPDAIIDAVFGDARDYYLAYLLLLATPQSALDRIVPAFERAASVSPAPLLAHYFQRLYAIDVSDSADGDDDTLADEATRVVRFLTETLQLDLSAASLDVDVMQFATLFYSNPVYSAQRLVCVPAALRTPVFYMMSDRDAAYYQQLQSLGFPMTLDVAEYFVQSQSRTVLSALDWSRWRPAIDIDRLIVADFWAGVTGKRARPDTQRLPPAKRHRFE